MSRLILSFAIVLFFSSQSMGGWFSDTDFYTVVLKSPSGKYIDGWIIQGAPKNDNGVYIFTIYRTKIEKKVPVQGTVVTKIGPKWADAYKMISAKSRRHLTLQISSRDSSTNAHGRTDASNSR